MEEVDGTGRFFSVVSCHPGCVISAPLYGSLYLSDAPNKFATESIKAGFEPVKGDTKLSEKINGFDMPVFGQLAYTGARPVLFDVRCVVSAKVEGLLLPLEVRFALAVNGDVIPETIAAQTLPVGVTQLLLVHGNIELQKGDYLELYVESEPDSSIVCSYYNLSAQAIV